MVNGKDSVFIVVPWCIISLCPLLVCSKVEKRNHLSVRQTVPFIIHLKTTSDLVTLIVFVYLFGMNFCQTSGVWIPQPVV